MDKFEHMKAKRKKELAIIIKETCRFKINGVYVNSNRIKGLAIIEPYYESDDGHILCTGTCELEAVTKTEDVHPIGCACTFSASAFIDDNDNITINDGYITLKNK